jgi:hypothetical protein
MIFLKIENPLKYFKISQILKKNILGFLTFHLFSDKVTNVLWFLILSNPNQNFHAT